MSDLSQDQVEKRAAIQKSATIWGAIVGVIAGLLALWLLGGQGSAVRYVGTLAVAIVAGYLVFRASFNSGAKTAKCEKCGATFSRSRTDRAETVTASTDKEEREEQPDGSVKVTTWVEDSLDVVDTYACANCGDATTNAYQTTRRRDEETVVQPAVSAKGPAQSQKGAAASAKRGKSGGSSSSGGKSSKG